MTLTMKQLDYITKTLMISKGAEEVAKKTAKQLKEGTFIHPGLFVVLYASYYCTIVKIAQCGNSCDTFLYLKYYMSFLLLFR